MKNPEQIMPIPEQQPEQKPPKIEDKDIAGLMEGIVEHDAAKAREAEQKKAVPEDRAGLGSMIEESLGGLDRGDAEREKQNKKEANTNLHERVGLSAAKTVRDVLGERLGEAMIVTNEPATKAYGMFMIAVDTVRRDVRAPSLEDAAASADPARLHVAEMMNNFVRQEVRAAFHAAFQNELKTTTLERERTRMQQLMELIDRVE
jgi:hypothetical protein